MSESPRTHPCPACKEQTDACCICENCYREWGTFLFLNIHEQARYRPIPLTYLREEEYLCKSICYPAYLKFKYITQKDVCVKNRYFVTKKYFTSSFA
jgi:hypothetical protein